jgi:hypothetical protein
MSCIITQQDTSPQIVPLRHASIGVLYAIIVLEQNEEVIIARYIIRYAHLQPTGNPLCHENRYLS